MALFGTKKQAPVSPLSAEYRRIEEEYRRNVAIVDARPTLNRLFWFAWTLLDVLLVLFAVYGVVFYVVDGSFRDARLPLSFYENTEVLHAASTADQPESLSVGDLLVAPTDAALSRFDLAVPVEHGNADWYAEFRYRFVWGGGESAWANGFVLGGVPFYATALGVEASSRPSDARLELEELSWHRFPKKIVPDAEAWLAERDVFVVADETFTDGLASFALTNASPYSYYEPTFFALVRRAGGAVGFTTFQAADLQAGETRQISLRFLVPLISPLTIDVFPLIPFYRDDAYLAPQ